MYLSGISTRRIAGINDALSRMRIGKHLVSRTASRLEEQQRAWREKPLKGKSYFYLTLDATYLKINWGGRVTNLAVLTALRVNEEGFRKVWRWRWLAGRKAQRTPRCFGDSWTEVLKGFGWS